MSLFIIHPDSELQHPHLLPEDEHHLLRVKRAKVGDEILLTDNKGHLARAQISAMITSRRNQPAPKKAVTFEVVEIKPATPLPPVTACLPLLHDPQRMEWAIEKLCELGAKNVQLFFSERCQKNSIAKNALARLEKTALAAQKQSERAWPLHILTPVNFRQILSTPLANIFFGHFSRTASWHHDLSKPIGEIMIMVGPEGGFTQTEISILQTSGAISLACGKHVLRSETAILSLVSRFTLN